MTVSRGTSIRETTRANIGAQLGEVVEPGDIVLIKVNLTGGGSARPGVNAHMEVVEEVARLAEVAGAGQVIVGEDAAGLGDTTECFGTCGLTDLARRCNFDLVDFSRERHRRVAVREPLIAEELEIAESVLNCDKLIGVTTLKTHHQARVTLSLKNMYSHIPLAAREGYHLGDLASAIVDTNSVRKADFNVIDGFIGVEGLGPILGRPVAMGLVLCGQDAVAVDSVGAQTMGVDPATVRHIRLAAQKNLGTSDQRLIDVVGEAIGTVARNFATPLDAMREMLSGHVEITEGSITLPGCTEVVVTAFQLLMGRRGRQPWQFEGLKISIEDTIALERGRQRVILGPPDALHATQNRLTPGCLPTVSQTMGAIEVLVGLTS